ncbi:hypothetical protein Slin15195_G103240 [Septoria linicola]|uniref:Uncharacterized protein n=1 Tax=Septoria linicola TaxID=215465 RepID=A0A9Q9AXM5_9PEZI|nr:hypothetical protein Slin14017_G066240 [Septoria linicola]USW57005.1 hypothetical protein Slin15195_G103240 [Septoria linicola]
MCCRRNQRRAPVAVTLAGAAYEKYLQHKSQKPLDVQDSTSIDSSRSTTVFQVQAANRPHLQALSTQSPEASPPSYEAVVNRAAMPDEPVIGYTKDGKPVPRSPIEDNDSVYSSDEASSLSSQSHAIAGIPEGMTWWQAYRARKAERREAWRAEKAEWRALKRVARGSCC